MQRLKAPHQRRGLIAIDGALALIVLMVIVQMYLLTASLDAYLAGRTSAALPGAIVSGLLFVCAVLLYGFIERLDRENRRS